MREREGRRGEGRKGGKKGWRKGGREGGNYIEREDKRVGGCGKER